MTKLLNLIACALIITTVSSVNVQAARTNKHSDNKHVSYHDQLEHASLGIDRREKSLHDVIHQYEHKKSIACLRPGHDKCKLYEQKIKHAEHMLHTLSQRRLLIEQELALEADEAESIEMEEAELIYEDELAHDAVPDDGFQS